MVSPMANSYLELFIYEASVLRLILLSLYKNSVKWVMSLFPFHRLNGEAVRDLVLFPGSHSS